MKRDPILSAISHCLLVALGGAAPAAYGGQPEVSVELLHAKAPSADAKIVSYRIDKPPFDSKQQTGDLHIIYSDGTEVMVKVPPRRSATSGEDVFNQQGFDDVKVSTSKRTIGWTEIFENCCTSYAVPLVLAIYRSGDSVVRVHQGQMVWYWDFEGEGNRVVAAWGPTHGPRVADYLLYESSTGRIISEVWGDEETQALPRDAPAWARQIESKF